jgi:CheY-like chemotaxis protein
MRETQKHTLLIVDDEDSLRDALVFEFSRRGFQVLSAANGTAALEIVKRERVDLIISDMRMPNGDGLFLLEQVRTLDPVRPYFIFVTGNSEVSRDECLAKGALQVFAKPFDRKALSGYVYKTLGLTA